MGRRARPIMRLPRGRAEARPPITAEDRRRHSARPPANRWAVPVRGDTIILSDLHFGRPGTSVGDARLLRPLLEDRAHLILNGDVAEVHHPIHRAEAARQTLALLDMCEAMEVSVTLISGNHDPFLSDRRHLLLASGRVLVTHGDVLHPAIAPWSPAAGRMRITHDEALRQFTSDSRDALEARLRATQHAAYAEWSTLEALSKEASESTLASMLRSPRLILQVLRYWRRFPALAAKFAEEYRPDAQIIVVGHTHRAGVWHVGPRTVLNTGSFGFPGRPHAVVLDGSCASLHAIHRTRSGYRLRSTPRFACAVPGAAAPAHAEPEAHAHTGARSALMSAAASAPTEGLPSPLRPAQPAAPRTPSTNAHAPDR